jgi:hypothetical protein
MLSDTHPPIGVRAGRGDTAAWRYQRRRRMTRLIASAFLSVLALGLTAAAHAVPMTFIAQLDGPSENPPNASPGTGTALVTIDRDAHTMAVDVEFEDLIGMTATFAALIHCCGAPPGNSGVATRLPTFPGFPLGVTSGTYQQTFDMTLASSFSAAFITGNGGAPASAEDALFDGIEAGMAYFNIRTDIFPGGEIRGFFEPAPTDIPEPPTLAALGLGLFGLGIIRRRWRA